MHISQPSLSSAIAALENEFGVVLFYRQHRGMQLTPAGEQLREMSKELLGHADSVEKTMRALGQEKKRLRLGIPPMLSSLFLPKIYGDFLMQHPDIQLQISELGRRALYARLTDDAIDMFFLPHNTAPERDLVCVPVTRLEVVCCVSKLHPLAKKTRVDIAELADVPLVLFKDSFFQTEEIKKRFALAGIEPNAVLQTDQLSTLTSILSGNAAAGFMFAQLAQANDDVATIALREPLYVDVSLAWKKGAYMTEPMQKFRKYIEKMQMS